MESVSRDIIALLAPLLKYHVLSEHITIKVHLSVLLTVFLVL